MPDEPAVQFLTVDALGEALARLHGTADHLLKIWLTLKQMGMRDREPPVLITTSSPTPALQRLFSFGSPARDLFVPFAHTVRFKTMHHDAARSVIQTNCRNWKNRTVVSCDPTEFLDIAENDSGELMVGPQRSYPLGLGFGSNGFALGEDARVSVPILAFAVWYFRQSPIPQEVVDNAHVGAWLVDALTTALRLSDAERAAVFVSDDWSPGTTDQCVTDVQLFQLCETFLAGPALPTATVATEDRQTYSLRIRSMQTITKGPTWLSRPPLDQLAEAVQAGNKAIILYGPPRTGKTRAIDLLCPRDSESRTTIQIHDGWGYDQLVEGFVPHSAGMWGWEPGPLKVAISERRAVIVLEEINRTQFTQALGEVFGLIETQYRGKENALTLRSGERLFVDPSTLFLFTMNTLDKSTEDIDDALLGRCAAVEFPPRVEDLTEILSSAHVSDEPATRLRELFAFILQYYPLGPGYFATLRSADGVITHYMTRIRPVLFNHFSSFRPETLALIDGKVDELFG